MAAELEMEDEELYESDDDTEDEEAEDDDTEDEESLVAAYRGFPRPFPATAPVGFGRFSGSPVAPGRDERRMPGVRAALIRGKDGATAVVRLPTAVATMQGVRRLGRRGAQAEAVLVQHERRLRALRSRENRIRTTITGSLILQHLRDVVAEARAAVGPAGWPAAWNPILAGTDYTLAATQTGFSVAAIPANRRSAPFWTLPLTTGLVASLGREALRPPVGLGVAAKPFWPDSVLAVGVPALVGAAASYLARPRRPRRYVRL